MPLHAFFMARMTFGAHTSKTRESTVNIAVSGSSRCTWDHLTDSVPHDGLPRARHTNLSALTSENMWYQHILIELLAVLLLLQPQIHISSCSSLDSSKAQEGFIKHCSWCHRVLLHRKDISLNSFQLPRVVRVSVRVVKAICVSIS